jgi:hypothetical protein
MAIDIKIISDGNNIKVLWWRNKWLRRSNEKLARMYERLLKNKPLKLHFKQGNSTDIN